MARRNKNDREEDEVPYDNEEDEDDDDDEEEEDEDVQRPAKRKYNPFIDEMAIVDDDDDDEEDDEDYGREDGFIEEETEELPSAAAIQRRHIELDRRRQQETDGMNDEEVAAFFKSKYSARKSQGFRASEEVPQQLLLPSVNDPNLWMVKCKPGKERDVVFGLMKRYFDRLNGDDPLDTFSAFARESLKGYIYIEARRQAHVQQKGSRATFGGWVRVKRGRYAGDLAQVLEVADSQDSARVKLVPRLDLESDDDDPNNKRKRGLVGSRPPQKLFNPERLASRSISSLQKKGPYWFLGTDHFRDGYLEKNMKVATLQVEDVSPTLDEIAKFASGGELNGEDGDRALDLSKLSVQAVNNAQASTLFQGGDTVEVIEGDMIHSIGVVDSVEESSVVVMLDVDGMKKRVTLPAKQLRKKFREGDHVKVINGRYKDESGMIVNVMDSVVTILSDATLNEVKVFAKDLREAADITLTRTVIGNYELHDLVQLDFHTVGTIVKVDRDSFKVLTQDSEIRTVEPHQITSKRETSRAVATDANGNSIRSGDSVVEIDGERRSCTILHLYRNLVFLHSRENVENYGVWVNNTRSVVSVAAKSRPSLQGLAQGRDLSRQQQPYGNSPGMGRGAPDGRGRGRGAARGGFYGRGRGGRDNLVAKTVRIAQGPHKGYVGIVKDTTDDMARVELHTNSKVINVDKSKLVLLDAQGGTIGMAVSNDRFATPNDFAAPSSTPRRYGEGGTTPMHFASGARTPAWNSGARTPNPYTMNGSKTPAWDSGSKTPNPHSFGSGSKASAWDSGSKTPMWGAETPHRSSGMIAKTPGFVDPGSKTPMWSGRYSENDMAPTPAAHSMVPPTPAASYGNTAPSPAPYPQTPAANYGTSMYDHTTTLYDSAPTPGANLIPATPAAMSAPTPVAHMLSAPTPGNYLPTTPGISAQTPFMPTGGDYHHVEDEDQDDAGDWPIEEIEVKVVSSHGNVAEGQLAAITAVNHSARTCTILLSNNNTTAELPFESLEPVRPSKKDDVKVILGEHRGELGSLIGVDSHDGIVRLRGDMSGFKIMGMSSVGKYRILGPTS
ncbi:hypothetical protein CLU79DRAFT_719569 [Phycomyces nitens]|nr:hypothetical protein CLU79DRAFT_719569 [Phycomyces nitens]